MLLGKARKLCPTLVTLPYDFPAYEAASLVPFPLPPYLFMV